MPTDGMIKCITTKADENEWDALSSSSGGWCNLFTIVQLFQETEQTRCFTYPTELNTKCLHFNEDVLKSTDMVLVKILYAELSWKNEHMFVFLNISWYWNGADSWNTPSYQWKIYSSHTFNRVAADDLVMFGARGPLQYKDAVLPV